MMIDHHRLEQMRAHVDAGGRLDHKETVDLLEMVEAMRLAFDEIGLIVDETVRHGVG